MSILTGLHCNNIDCIESNWSQVDPFHNNLEVIKVFVREPRDIKSAEFAFNMMPVDSTCLANSITYERFKTSRFRTKSRMSVQYYVLSNLILIICFILCIKHANTNAPHSSNLGIVSRFKGATRDFEQSMLHMTASKLQIARIQMQAPYALSLASVKPCNSIR